MLGRTSLSSTIPKKKDSAYNLSSPLKRPCSRMAMSNGSLLHFLATSEQCLTTWSWLTSTKICELACGPHVWPQQWKLKTSWHLKTVLWYSKHSSIKMLPISTCYMHSERSASLTMKKCYKANWKTMAFQVCLFVSYVNDHAAGTYCMMLNLETKAV